jgi:hypothetical protein
LTSTLDPKPKATMLPLLFIPLLFVTGCPHPGATAKQIAYDSAACIVGQVPAAVADTVGEAKSSLLGDPGAPSWSDFAKGDLIKYGIDAAICIVAAAIHDIDAAMAAKGQVRPGYIGAHQLAADWLEQHGVHHVHAGSKEQAWNVRYDHSLMALAVVDAIVSGSMFGAIPQICDSAVQSGSDACRPVVIDDEFPAVDSAR